MSTLKKSHVFAFINVYYFLNVQLQKTSVQMQMKVAWYSKHLLRHIGHDYSIILQPRFLIILVGLRGGFALRISLT